MSRRAAIFGSLVLVLAGLSACDEDIRRPPPAIPTGCGSSTVCPADLECVEGACVGAAAPSWPFRLRFRPADEQLAPLELFDELRFAEGDPVRRLDRPMPLPRRVAIIGAATRGGEARPVRATARPLDGIQAQPLVYSSEPVELTGEGPRFLLGLPAWWPVQAGGARAIRYALEVRSDELPPFSLERRFGPGDDRFTVELPEGELVPIEGEVRVSEANPVPLRGVRVSATDEAGNRISPVGTTDESGAFQLVLWPAQEARQVVLRVSAGMDPLPDVTQPLEVPAGGAPPFQVVHIGDTGQLFTVTGRVGSEAGVVRARVEFDGQVGNGRFRRTAMTDEAGELSVDLYPGTYEVEVVPNDDGGPRYRISRSTVTVAPGDPLSLPLKPRIEVTGQVVDVAGAPVAQAVVETELVRAVYGDPGLEVFDETPPARSVRTETNDDGRFLLLLDRGLHRLRITPPALSGLPPIETEVEASPGGLPVEARYEIPPAAAVILTLVDEGQTPLQGVVTEVWRTDLEVPVRVGRATSDENGRVTVAVPADDEPAPGDAGLE